MTISQEEIRNLLDYNPDTGLFFWKRNRGKILAGTKAGHPNSMGHLEIKINYKAYLAHRLAWLYIYGHFPEGDIDHANRVRNDNRLSNLRLATRSQNIANSRRKLGASGYRGVHAHGPSWRAMIKKNGKLMVLGTYKTPEAAYEAYCKASKKLFGEFSCLEPLLSTA